MNKNPDSVVADDRIREIVREEISSLTEQQNRNKPSLTRRGTLAALGAAGAGVVGFNTATGTATAVTDSNVNATEYNNHVYMVGDNGYTTIQAAHDAIPSNEFGIVHVTGSYNNSDSWPIEWTKRARLTSDGKIPIGETSNSSEFTLEVNFELPDAGARGNRPPGPSFDNLQIVGGKAGVYVRSARFTTWYNVDVDGAANSGFRFSHGNYANNSHVLVACSAEDCGRDGISISDVTHAVNLIGCTSQFNGRYGVKIGRAYACSIHGGAYQNNDDYGVFLDNAHACTIHNSYLEKNCLGKDPSTEGDAMAQAWIGNESDGCHVESSYINSDLGNSKFGVIFNNAYRCSYRNNVFRSDNDTHSTVGHVNIISGEDIDVYKTSNVDDYRNASVIPSGYDGGTNTLSFGQPY